MSDSCSNRNLVYCYEQNHHHDTVSILCRVYSLSSTTEREKITVLDFKRTINVNIYNIVKLEKESSDFTSALRSASGSHQSAVQQYTDPLFFSKKEGAGN